MEGIAPSPHLGRSPPAPISCPAPSPPASSAKPKLIDRLREALRGRHYSRRTEETCCHEDTFSFREAAQQADQADRLRRQLSGRSLARPNSSRSEDFNSIEEDANEVHDQLVRTPARF